jgi:flagellar protein FlaG
MGFDIAPIGSTPASATSGPAQRQARAAGDEAVLASGDLPASPPPEVLEAIDAAARCYRDLHARGRELRFGVDADSGRVTVDVCDLDGNVLRSIPPSEALDVAGGAPLD